MRRDSGMSFDSSFDSLLNWMLVQIGASGGVKNSMRVFVTFLRNIRTFRLCDLSGIRFHFPFCFVGSLILAWSPFKFHSIYSAPLEKLSGSLLALHSFKWSNGASVSYCEKWHRISKPSHFHTCTQWSWELLKQDSFIPGVVLNWVSLMPVRDTHNNPMLIHTVYPFTHHHKY